MGGAAGSAAASAVGQTGAIAAGQQKGYSGTQFLVDVGIGTALGTRAGTKAAADGKAGPDAQGTAPQNPAPSPNRVNASVPAPEVPPDNVFGRSFQDFGRDVIRWGSGADGALARMETVTFEELSQAGVTQAQARAARDFYAGVLARNPGNAAAAARVQLVDRVLQLLRGH
jgi:hypothetical protein